MTRAIALVAFATLVACSRGEAPSANARNEAGASATPAVNANVNAKADADASANAGAKTTPPSAWVGHYTAIAGTLTIVDHFHPEDASVGLGDGAMNVALDDRGRASGTIDGALGATKIDGALEANDFSATLVPDDLAHGFTGTAIGTRAGDRIAGTMRLALPTGNVIREATFTLDRKP